MLLRNGFLSFCFLYGSPFLSAQSVEIKSDVRQVTLYREQALVTREVKIPRGKGVREFVVRGLPSHVVLDSLFAESSNGTEVRGLRISPQKVDALDPLVANKQVLESSRLMRERAAAERRLQSLSKNLGYIDQLMGYSATTAHQDLNRGVLNSQSLTDLTGFAMKQRSELIEEQLKLETQIADLASKQEEEVARDLDALPSKDVKFEVLITIDNQDNEESLVRLNYLVGNCGWSPKYSIYGSTGKADFQVKYGAMVQQRTGEKWEQVKLVLSTSSPSISAAGPSLNPFRVSLAGPITNVDSSDPFGSQKAQADTEQSTALDVSDKIQRDLALNSNASRIQNLELLAETGLSKAIAPDSGDDVASQSYAIEKPVNLDSRLDTQMVQIFDTPLSGNLYHVATPLLSTFAYREADIVNQRPEGLLRGPATVYLDNRFVGQMEIPSTASGQHITVGFGADQQVRTRRELLEKTEDQKGGNRMVTFRYRLVVANFKSMPVTMRMIDRVPLPAQATEVSTLVESRIYPISQDVLFRRVQYPRGILRWDLSVPAERFGGKAFDLEYTVTAEFDRNRTLAAFAPVNQKRADTRELGTRPNSSVMSGGMGGMGGGMGGYSGK